jgi:hypothetical protein
MFEIKKKINFCFLYLCELADIFEGKRAGGGLGG